MQILQNNQELLTLINKANNQNMTIGFVPTMGALHLGHASLIELAKKQCNLVICSIFVNPTQFNNQSDLLDYPKTIEQDKQLLKELGCHALFLPKTKDIYPEEVKSKEFDFKELTKHMEGKFRKGHFNGVATVVSRLFDLVQPNLAYFGEKDFQQLQIVRDLAHQFYPSITIVPAPIAREANGLAMSSRNKHLNLEEKKEAALIYKSLQLAKRHFTKLEFKEIHKEINQLFANSNLDLEYFVIANEENLRPMMQKKANVNYRAFIACYADKIRLIDNLSLTK